ncbi:hypothetical protein M422DRAFT_248573, partial [Sphaerobolus stellatus SS14]
MSCMWKVPWWSDGSCNDYRSLWPLHDRQGSEIWNSNWGNSTISSNGSGPSFQGASFLKLATVSALAAPLDAVTPVNGVVAAAADVIANADAAVANIGVKGSDVADNFGNNNHVDVLPRDLVTVGVLIEALANALAKADVSLKAVLANVDVQDSSLITNILNDNKITVLRRDGLVLPANIDAIVQALINAAVAISARNLSVRNYPSRQPPSGSNSVQDSPSAHLSTPVAEEWEVWLETVVVWWRELVPRRVANIPSFALTDESPDASEATAPESPSQQPFGIPYGNPPAMTTEAKRLKALELTLAEDRLKTERIENQLQQLIELLNPARAATELAPPGNSPSVQVMDEGTPSEMSTRRGFQVLPSNPSDFDGDHEKGQSFLNSCSLYFSIAGRAFQDEQARISWALTFFKTGQAA